MSLPASKLMFLCTKVSDSIEQCPAYGNRTKICVSAYGKRTQNLCCSYIFELGMPLECGAKRTWSHVCRLWSLTEENAKKT